MLAQEVSAYSKPELTLERANKLLKYDPTVGKSCLIWKEDRTTKSRKGMVVGSPDKDGYWRTTIDYKSYKCHRLVWFISTGRWPSGEIDHINGDVNDNRIDNLRECNRAENCQNTKVFKTNSSGLTGVSYHKRASKFHARISIKGKLTHLGLFNTAEEAYSAYLKAKKEHHEFQPIPRYESAISDPAE